MSIIDEIGRDAFKELPKNAVPLEYIIYYIKEFQNNEKEFVRLFKTDTGYEVRHIVEDTVFITLGENDITFGKDYADITAGEWKGVRMSCKDEDIMPLTALILDAYKNEDPAETE